MPPQQRSYTGYLEAEKPGTERFDPALHPKLMGGREARTIAFSAAVTGSICDVPCSTTPAALKTSSLTAGLRAMWHI